MSAPELLEKGERFRLLVGDCLALLSTLPDCSVDAIVTDPPAGISFMSAHWDGDKGGRDQWIAWLVSVMLECRRVLKPGGHALVWALPRTSHWTATAIEDAEFEVRDRITHLFGQGFPKSHNLRGEWDGWGTALKPGGEDWWLARKPLQGTVAANVEQWGTGALNIDACRIEAGNRPHRVGSNARDYDGWGSIGAGSRAAGKTDTGRWPGNVLLSPEAAAEVDAQSGDRPAGSSLSGNEPSAVLGSHEVYHSLRARRPFDAYGDTGGASRFFYVAKPDRAEREAGLSGFVGRPVNDGRQTPIDNPYQRGDTVRQNTHPTVKPIALMRWLCRLITPPGGIVLDPFTGSGTTGAAALAEGLRFVGIEREPEYAAIADARLRHAAADTGLFAARGDEPRPTAAPPTLDLFGDQETHP